MAPTGIRYTYLLGNRNKFRDDLCHDEREKQEQGGVRCSGGYRQGGEGKGGEYAG